MRPALLALAGLAVGLPVMAALASVDRQTTGGLPARYVPWTHTGRRIHATEPRTPSPAVRTATPVRPPVQRQAPRTRHHEPRPRPPAHGVPPRPSPSVSGLGGPLAGRPRPADLRVSITAPKVVRPRGAFSYAVRLANRGPGTPDAITVRSLLPAGVVRTGSSLPDGVGGYAGGRDATLVMGRLAPGRSVTTRFRVRVRPKVRGDLVAWSGVVYSGGAPDRRPGDNTATFTTRVERGK